MPAPFTYINTPPTEIFRENARPIPKEKEVSIGLSLIARNEEQNLAHLLASIGGAFDQVAPPRYAVL